MKKILLLMMNVFVGTILHAQTLDYSNYHRVFYDEFDYPSLTSGNASSGTTIGTTFSSNWTDTSGWSPSPTILTLDTPGQVTLQSDATSPNFIRLTETSIGSAGSTLNHKSGIIGINTERDFNYGIIEAKVRFSTPLSPIATLSAGSAFWVNQSTGTEIDIFDDALNNWLPLRVIDWSYHDNAPSVYTTNYQVTDIIGSTQLSPFGITELDSNNWHVYSAEWLPTGVSYYIDGNFLGAIPYSDVKTYPGYWFTLQLALYADSATIGGQYMDIDWVKLWRPSCATTGMINITPPGSGTSPNTITPGLYKNDAYEVTNPTILASIDPLNITIFEAEATTILPNFIADETNFDVGDYPLSSLSYTGITNVLSAFFGANPDSSLGIPNAYGPIYLNAFFEILPTNCDTTSAETGFRIASSDSSKRPKGGIGNYANGVNNVKFIGTNSALIDTNTIIDNAFNYTQIQVYPNPTQSNVTISYPCTSDGQLMIKISDVDGRIRYTETVVCNEGNNAQTVVDLNSFTPGVYYIDLTLNDQHTVKKIVKL